MRALNELETKSVAGGVCEGMSQADCWNGVGDVIVNETSTVFGAVTKWYQNSQFRQLSGDLGIWFYELPHGSQ